MNPLTSGYHSASALSFAGKARRSHENSPDENLELLRRDLERRDFLTVGEIDELVGLAAADPEARLANLMTPGQLSRAITAHSANQHRVNGPALILFGALAAVYSYLLGNQVLPEDLKLATEILAGGGGTLAGIGTCLSGRRHRRTVAWLREQAAQRRGEA